MATEDSRFDVPLVAGLGQDSEYAVLPAPGLLVLENGLLNKRGVIKKRPGIVSVASRPVSNTPTMHNVFDDRGTTVVETDQGTHLVNGTDLLPSRNRGFVPADVRERVLSRNGRQVFVQGSYIYTLSDNGTDLTYSIMDLQGNVVRDTTVYLAGLGSSPGILRLFVTSTHFIAVFSSGTSYVVARAPLTSLFGTSPPSVTTNSYSVSTATATDVAITRMQSGLGFAIAAIGSSTSPAVNTSLRRFNEDGSLLVAYPNTRLELGGTTSGHGRLALLSADNCLYVAAACDASAELGRAVIRHYDTVGFAWSTTRTATSLLHPDFFATIQGRGTRPTNSQGIALGKVFVGGTERLAVWICSGATYTVAGVLLAITYATTLTYTNIHGQGDVNLAQPLDVAWNHYLGSQARPLNGTPNHAVVLRHAGIVRNNRDLSLTGKAYTELGTLGASLLVTPSVEDSPKIRPVARFALGEGRFTQLQIAPGGDVGGQLSSGLDNALRFAWLVPRFDNGAQGPSCKMVTIQQISAPQRNRSFVVGEPHSAGVPSSWDGLDDWEIAPHYIPVAVYYDDRVSPPVFNATSRVTYEATDARGNTRRSAPSNIGFVYVTQNLQDAFVHTRAPFGGAQGGVRATNVVPPSMWSNVYYTAETTAPNLYYEQSRGGTTLIECPNLILWGSSPNALFPLFGKGPLLYTTGDVLETTLPPSFLSVAEANGRLWGAEGDTVWYSKPLVPGVVAEFNANLRVQIPQEGGLLTGIAPLDDKLVVFRETATYVVFGNPATAIGTNENLRVIRVQGEVGCPHPGTILPFTQGVAFCGARGFYALSRGLDLQYIGGPVEDTVRAAVGAFSLPFLWSAHEPVTKTLRFASPTWHFVFDYENGQWSLFTSSGDTAGGWSAGQLRSGACASSLYLGRETFATAGLYDTQSPTRMAIQTGWISTAGVQGFQRVKDIGFLWRPGSGTGGNGDARVSLYHDNDLSTVVSQHTLAGLQARGSGRYTPYFVRVKKQKCSSIAIRIEELAIGGQGGDLVNSGLSGLTLMVGSKYGTNKHLRPGRKV